jgi:2-polyprenyl-6-methoxyphenol hydroxylase-like FAD-dependent oxidoreductase
MRSSANMSRRPERRIAEKRGNARMSERTPVLIVGAGPVGLALAGELGWRGVPCTLIEKTDGSIEQPKMDIVGPRTMEFCRRWGIADWVRDAPYPGDYPQDCVYVTSLDGYELGRERFPGRAQEKCPPQSPQKRERVPQDMFDPILQRFVRSFPHVRLCYRSELVSFAENSGAVTARLRDLASGETREIAADYLVGTDGGASLVRERAGITMSGNPALTYTTNVMFRCADFPSLHDKGKAYRFIFIGPEGTWLTIVAINGGDRFRMSIVGSADKVNHSEADIHAALRRAVGRAFDYELLSVMRWVRRELVADSYGTDRVFIAGDAAHLMSPTGGFGMNTGIQDAVDLGWKLAAAVRGWGGRSLLRTYEIERRPVAVRNVGEASSNLGRMLSTRQRLPPPEIFQAGPAGAAARADYGRGFTATMRHEWFTIGFHLGYRYDGSPIVVPDGTPAPPLTTSTYVQTARPGARAPHAWLPDGRSTLDLYGRGFVLLQLGRDAPSGEDIARAAAAASVPLDVIALDLPEVTEVYQRKLVLVRPDGHVAWRADAPPADPRALIEVVRGADECDSLRQGGRMADATPAITTAAHIHRGGRP